VRLGLQQMATLVGLGVMAVGALAFGLSVGLVAVALTLNEQSARLAGAPSC
jgi:hypothetical protein